jgi:hypothetical protein
VTSSHSTQPPENTQPAPLLDLLATLDLEELGSAVMSVQPLSTADTADGTLPTPLPETFAEDITLFRGQSQKQPHGRVFGGQVLAQGVIACGRTVRVIEGGEKRRLHSLHAYFMRPGDDTQPITFSVERMRDGRSFSTRRVHAIQHGKPILSMSASFQDPDAGLDHQDPFPQTPSPDTLPSLAELFEGVDHPAARHMAEGRAIDQRHVDGNLFAPPATDQVADQRVWMRATGSPPGRPAHPRRRAGLRLRLLAARDDPAPPRPHLDHARACGQPASTTPCGSTARRAPTSGSSTPSTPRRRRAGGAWASAGCSPKTASSWPPSRRRACCACPHQRRRTARLTRPAGARHPSGHRGAWSGSQARATRPPSRQRHGRRGRRRG